MRIAAVAVFICLVAPSVARIVCGWECITQRAATQAATCHEHQPAGDNALARGSVTTCHDDRTAPVKRVITSIPNGAAVAHIGVPLHQRPAVWLGTVASVNISPPPGHHLSSIQLRI
jgi:hypothetical protein